MRGVVFTGERELELMQFPDPTPGAHDVVIEMKASGMSGWQQLCQEVPVKVCGNNAHGGHAQYLKVPANTLGVFLM